MWCSFGDLRFQSRVRKKKRIIIIRIVPKLEKQKKIPMYWNLLTRMLQFQATVKRFQFDLYVNLEGQHMLISS